MIVFHILQECKKDNQLSYQILVSYSTEEKTKWLCITTENAAISHMSAPDEISCMFYVHCPSIEESLSGETTNLVRYSHFRV
jgi:hypothetical protein